MSATVTELTTLDRTIEAGTRRLLELQAPDGWWVGELESNATMVAEHVDSTRSEHRQREGGQPLELFGIPEGRPERHPLVQELIGSAIGTHGEDQAHDAQDHEHSHVATPPAGDQGQTDQDRPEIQAFRPEA